MRLRVSALLTIAAVSTLFILTSSQAFASGLTVTPYSGKPGTSFTFHASGFDANESLSLWVSMPDTSVKAQPGGSADGNGDFTFKLDSTGYQAGGYVEVVHGNSSTREFSVYFEIASANTDSGGKTGGGGGGGNGGGSARFSASGFAPDERLSMWGSFSDGVVRPMPYQSADAAGNANFAITPDPSWPGGDVVVVAHGLSSGHEATNRMNFSSGASSGGSAPSNPGPGVASGAGVYQAGGFSPYEQLAVWGQFSDGLVRTLPNQSADGAGNARFAIQPAPGWPSGSILVVAHGMSSGHEVAVSVSMNGGGGGSPSGDNSNQTTGNRPLSSYSAFGAYVGNTDTTLTPASCNATWHPYGIGGPMYIGYIGFQPGEDVHFWASLPDLSAYGLGSGTADSRGAVLVKYVPGPAQLAGHYHIIAHGMNNGLELCGHFDWVR